MKVEIIDIMGNDLSVVNAARVSYAKVKEQFDDSDDKLIKYLAEHNHWSPFAHTFLSFRIEAPIFVARQLVKHQIGLVWNEESRRYINDTPKLHKIKQWREKPKNSKQGSGDQIVIDNFYSKKTPLCGVLGGGYNKSFDKLIQLHSMLHKNCAEYF